MALYGWENCPDQTKRQVADLLDGLLKRLGSNLAGLYLHGSLAMGCFHPSTSDIDLLAVVERAMPSEAKRSLIELLLSLSGSPHPLEISLLRPEDMSPWRYPVPFDLHYSEDWRERYVGDLATGVWKEWGNARRTDPDLAAHITVIRARGIRLSGESIERAFPDVPRSDYLASITADLEWAGERLAKNPVYAVLNSCRVFAYLQDGRIFSKAEGAVRSLEILPAEFHPLVRTALEISGSGQDGESGVALEMVKQLVDFVHGIAKAAG
ncbi:MAG: aminoglycoside adenylyltransferase domain-containing protein [Anaerolineales bacterium]